MRCSEPDGSVAVASVASRAPGRWVVGRHDTLMRTASITSILGLALLFTGCGKQAGALTASTSPATAVAQPAMTAWEQGDKSAAVASFAETDWSKGPLFPPSSPLSLSESQFTKLSNAERQSKSAEMMPQVDSLKRLAAAVAQAGRDAAAKGETAQARKYFTALKQCGAALDSPDRLRLVQLVGQGLKKTAEAELTKLGQ